MYEFCFIDLHFIDYLSISTLKDPLISKYFIQEAERF
jgi:hypothetical protein